MNGKVMNPGDSEINETSTAESRIAVEAIGDSGAFLEAVHESDGEDLSREAIDRWADYLSATDDAGLGYSGNDAWDGFAEADVDGGDPTSAEIFSPTAQEITDLLAQLASTTACEAPSPDVAGGGSAEVRPAKVGMLEGAAEDDSLEIHSEVREAFMDDAGRCVSSMEEAVLAFEAHPDNREPLQQICRDLHTLKGASGSIGLVKLADYLHHFEDSLRDDNSSAPPSIESLFAKLDTIRGDIERVAGAGKTSEVPSGSAVADRPVATPATPPDAANDRPAAATAVKLSDTAADEESVRVKSSQLNRLMDMLAELVMLRNRRDSELSELKGVHAELIQSASRLRVIGDGPGHSDGVGPGGPRETANTSAAGSAHPLPRLTEVASDILESAQRLRDCYQPVAEGNLAVSQFIRHFRQELVELRRMPVSGLFRRLQRVASDAARAEQKQVQLRLIGEDTGIERSLQERLYEPLLHIIRNAVSHGIEEKQERVRQGKDAAGVVTLEAQTGPDLLVLEIRDDGRGLNYDALRRRGIETGLLKPDKGASRDELAMLIFQPGFSTQQTASQISGRGVGMDVVASAITRMRGWVEVDSTPGRGTTVRLTFPLPSVIQHTMVFRAAGQLFALPMQFVHGAGCSAEDVRAVRFESLFRDVDDEGSAARSAQMLVLACETPSSGLSDTRRLALWVDEIVGPEEVVVRPMPSLLKHHPLCAGATLSGMGEVVLVLDKHRLRELVLRHVSDRPPIFPFATSDTRSGTDLPKVLVVDDSRSARRRMVRSLARYQVEITEASDGAEASGLVKRHDFAAVFSDLEMPRQNGLELLSEIRAGGSTRDLPVVIVSSRADDEVQRRAMDLGAHAYLVKPLVDAALDDAVTGLPEIFRRHSRAAGETADRVNGQPSIASMLQPLQSPRHGETV